MKLFFPRWIPWENWDKYNKRIKNVAMSLPRSADATDQ